jgi:hypothetical protein
VNRDDDRNRDQEAEIPGTLREDLRAAYGERPVVPPEVDDAILAAARWRLAAQRGRPRPGGRRTWHWLPVAAAAALILVFWTGELMKDEQPDAVPGLVALRDDADGDGRIDIRDELLLARRQEAERPAEKAAPAAGPSVAPAEGGPAAARGEAAETPRDVAAAPPTAPPAAAKKLERTPSGADGQGVAIQSRHEQAAESLAEVRAGPGDAPEVADRAGEGIDLALAEEKAADTEIPAKGRAAVTSRRAARLATAVPDTHTVVYRLVITTGGDSLAAYQVTIRDAGGRSRLVAVEGGEEAAFSRPPRRRPADPGGGETLSAFSLAADLPAGRCHVATLHLAVAGEGEPDLAVTLEVAADAAGRTIPATVGLERREGP